MKDDTVYVLLKGEERVSVTDHQSLLDLSMAMLISGCTDLISQKEIKGHKPATDIFKVSFMDKTVSVLGQTDVEKVINWMLSFGCTKIAIEREGEKKDDGKD